MSLGKPRRTQLSVDEEGVSPVVGMILVMAISIVGIAAIMYWGLPAIDEMKANVEHRSVETQFTELDSSIKELVAGTTEKAAKRWQPSMNRGSVLITDDSEAWLYATEMYSATKNYDILWYDFGYDSVSGDPQFTFVSKGEPLLLATISVQRVLGTASFDDITVDNPTRASITADTATEFEISEAGFRWDEGTVLLTVTLEGSPIAKAWYVNTGLIDYELSAGVGTKSVLENNGAVISGTNGAYLVTNTPPLPPQSTPVTGIPRFFARAITLSGEGSFAGSDRFDILMSLYQTTTLESRDCVEPSTSTCVESSKVFIFGTYQAPWYAYLKSAARGYEFQELPWPSSGTPEVTYLGYRAEDTDAATAYMGYTLLQSTITLSTSG